jgi:hypothetical protein
MSSETVSRAHILALVRHAVPSLSRYPNSISERLASSTVFERQRGHFSDALSVSAQGPAESLGDLPHTNLRFYQYGGERRRWGLEVGLSTDGNVNNHQITFAYQGQSEEPSHFLGINVHGGKYFILNPITNTFEIARDKAQGYKKHVEVEGGLRDFLDNSQTSNSAIEWLQRKDRVALFGFEFAPNMEVLGFKVRGVPTPESVQNLVLPTQVQVRLK